MQASSSAGLHCTAPESHKAAGRQADEAPPAGASGGAHQHSCGGCQAQGTGACHYQHIASQLEAEQEGGS